MSSTYTLVSHSYENGVAKVVIKEGDEELIGSAAGGTEADALVRALRQATGLYIRLKEFGTPVEKPAWVEISIKNGPVFRGYGNKLAEAYIEALNQYARSKMRAGV